MAIRRLVHAICSAIANWSAPKQEALVHVPAPTGTWLQVIDGTSSNRRGFHYKCLCGQEYEYRNELSISGSCECCKRSLDLLLSIDAVSPDGILKVTPDELERRLGALAIKRVAQPTRQQPFIPVGDWSVSDSGQWNGPQPLGSNGEWI